MNNSDKEEIKWNFDTVFLVHSDASAEEEMLVKRLDRNNLNSNQFWSKIKKAVPDDPD